MVHWLLIALLSVGNYRVTHYLCLFSGSSRQDTGLLSELPGAIDEYRNRNHPETTVAFWAESSMHGCAFASEDAVLPAASTIKLFILLCAYLEFRGQWNEVPADLAAILSYEEGFRAPLGMFGSTARQEISRKLGNMTYAGLASSMMGRNQSEIGNPAYNAAANVLIFLLGGPAECTRRIHSIHEDLGSVRVGRYMLAERTPENENLCSVRALSTACRVICARELNGLASDDYDRISGCMQRISARGHYCYQKHGHLSVAPTVNAWVGWVNIGGEYCIYSVVVNTWERNTVVDEGADHYCEYIRSYLIDLHRASD